MTLLNIVHDAMHNSLFFYEKKFNEIGTLALKIIISVYQKNIEKILRIFLGIQQFLDFRHLLPMN